VRACLELSAAPAVDALIAQEAGAVNCTDSGLWAEFAFVRKVSQFRRLQYARRYCTAIVTEFETASPSRMLTGTAFPVGDESGICALI
jgi:hypothetical protein